MTGDKNYDIGVYYFPNYHPDARNAKWHGEGWTEWELVKAAKPRFPGHYQPRVPSWGYRDEADPEVMAVKIDAAADHGIASFIFDWYWYEDGPYLQRCLDEGFLGAKNNGRLKFSLMWANHDWLDIHPATRSRSWPVMASGLITPKAFEEATDHMIRNYFGHPSYWRVNGGLYLSFYEVMTLIKSLGGLENTAAALNGLRERVRAAGYGELHLNAVIWGLQILPGENALVSPDETALKLGFDSVTSYCWIHHVNLKQFPETPYSYAVDKVEAVFAEKASKFTVPYFPNVTVGWDSSPRTIMTDKYDNLGYPFMSIMSGNTPEEFERGLRVTKAYADTQPENVNVITLNAWNEWTEGSYLEPDLATGMKFLEAIKKVFGKD